jgi:cyclic beta-1,2-glucan synthetase
MTDRPTDPAFDETIGSAEGEPKVCQLEAMASQLAQGHPVSSRPVAQDYLLTRLADQKVLLAKAYRHFLSSSEKALPLSYAAEWLLDNYHLIQQVLRQVEADLPATYYRQLPKLGSESVDGGFPRVYILARDFILHEAGQIDPARARRFVAAYQTIQSLTMGEVWALPTMLRFVVLESVTQAVGRLTGLTDGQPALVAGLVFQYELADADIVAAGIPALRILNSEDWSAFFEDVSLVEQTLRRDPVRLYERMTFGTRNRYRTVIEELAFATGRNEVEIAQSVVRLAAQAATRLPLQQPAFPNGYGDQAKMWAGLDMAQTSHIGYYLIGDGRRQLEHHLEYHPTGRKAMQRAILARPALFYLGSIGLLTSLMLALLIGYALSRDGTLLQTVGVGLFGLIPTVTMAVHLANWLTTNTIPPRVLPKLDFRQGVPAACRTMVVIPALLTNLAEVKSLLSQLEQHYLSNVDPHLTFALLTDFADATDMDRPEDEGLVIEAKAGLEALNQRYPGNPFYLFHRRRLWNSHEGVWMGLERKRGKLHEFNRLLRGDQETSYAVQAGDLTVLPEIRYVITLDADTVLVRESAQRLIATLAHPLNRAEFDSETGKVTAGYTILQPRTEIKPTIAQQSFFTRIFAGDTGLDLYTLAVSDVYQDLFGQGIYVGKGIYEVDAFERSLEGYVAQNTLLSHDLFEGIHGRVGLVTDVILYEDYPPHYLLHARRLHRWIRGDWQLLPWLLPQVPHASDQKIANSLALIDLWKIGDNLRRSLLAPALLLLLILGWTWLPGSPLLWTVFGILAPAGALMSGFFSGGLDVLKGVSSRQVSRALSGSVSRWLLALAFIPYESGLTLKAMGTTLVRLFITRRNLLQWMTAATSARLFETELKPYVTWQQWMLVLTAAVGLGVYLIRPGALPVATPLLIGWLLSPAIAYWISRPIRRREEQLTEAQRRQLRNLARRTWLFFERFVGPEDHWLPPDHFQESPRAVIAHRTSPTNIGLFLLSALAAYDLGYIEAMDLTVRLRSTFDTLARLERYRGHFLNWIDTRTLEALPVRYISTVDSGNLAGCLLALKQGCLSIPQQPLWRWARWEGLLDTLAVLAEAVNDSTVPGATGDAVAFVAQAETLRQAILNARSETQRWPALLHRFFENDRPELDRLLVAWVEAGHGEISLDRLQHVRLYMDRLDHHLHAMRRELEMMLPWVVAIGQPPALFDQPNLNPILAAAWKNLTEALTPMPTLAGVSDFCQTGCNLVADLQSHLPADSLLAAEAQIWCRDVTAKLNSSQTQLNEMQTTLTQIVAEIDRYSHEMDIRFLFDAQRRVFHIGYNLETDRLDGNYYDLLASEARIASLIAIAKDDVPRSHWLHLGRPLARLAEGQALMSWSGTMFEYLMPSLLMHNYAGTLLHQSMNAAVDYQIAYGRQQGVPWGISESGYYAFDANLNYQYRAFGAPALGFKRGLAEDLVIAPYASLLALAWRPRAVLDNMADLVDRQMVGQYGFYEALDFTPAHLTLGQPSAIVRSYMAHHQGMIMLSLVNYLDDEVMIHRFHAEPRIRSVELLLQERIPPHPVLESPAEETLPTARPIQQTTPLPPWTVPLDPPLPQVHYLSNGHYGLLVTSSGGSFSQWQDLSLTRWQPDTTLENWGSWLYLQDDETGALWSAGYQPTAVWPEQHEVLFHPHLAEFRRRDHGISLQMEVTVSPDDDVELRRGTLTNTTDQPRSLTLTSYGEVVLAPHGTDNRHPAFAKLFVESQYVPQLNGLLFRRRPRSADEKTPYLLHALLVEPDQVVTGDYESDRACFIGRGGTARRPAALVAGGRLSKTTGATLDPIFAIAQKIDLPPHHSTQLTLLTLVAESHEAALSLAERYQRGFVVEQAFLQARTRSEREARQLGFETPFLEKSYQLLGLLFYPHAARRSSVTTLAANQKGQADLWAFGISGDYPILLVQMADQKEMSLLRELLQAHIYWRNRQLQIDLVILNEEEASYGQAMQGTVFRLIHQMDSDNWINRRGGIFVLRDNQLGQADRVLLLTAARVVLDGSAGSLADQLNGLLEIRLRLPHHVPTLALADVAEETPPVPRPDNLQFDNDLGGFSPDGSEYQIYLRPGMTTPLPWINVIANPDFGCLVSESGSGYTWAANSGENRLTPWRNDPISDLPGEAIYLRDEETAAIWSPTPQPAPAPVPYLVRHGSGYTIFEHHSYGLKQELRLFVAPDAPVKIVQLRVENIWSRPRRITATYYAEWVLGPDRETHQQFIVPEYDEAYHAFLARNPYSIEFGQQVAFLAASQTPHSLTADRTEFLGRLGSYACPAGLVRIGLESRVEAGLDPCAALQLHLDLAPGESKEVYFILGQGADREEARSLIQRYQEAATVATAWDEARQQWNDILGAVQVETPDPAMNLLLNRWLLYQALSCRIWGRSALYQSSGAYGFRDQLQDVMSVIHARPDLTREQILRAARHQFVEGDVLHWWHPPSGRGARTRIHDDLLWLPYVTAHYIHVTGDESILREEVPFLKGDLLAKDEEERYGQFDPTAETYSLYEHCRRALTKGDTSGPHQLPLMGSGDWNDGMNRVGIEGRGESIWLGWFLYACLIEFAAICDQIGETAQAETYRRRAEVIQQAVEQNGWDGQWYRRAYYDDGTPLGSSQNKECRIDSIAQSWGVISGAANPARVEQAMDQVLEQLVRWEDGLILLFTPPFDQTSRDPGYIKGYLPGIRENGGQYTHATLWTIWAFAEMGRGELAEKLFRLINPVYRSDTPEKADGYKVEPYVIVADVYGVAPHTGRGGWTWYTGSSGWMYRLGIEAILGLHRREDILEIKPQIPAQWSGYRLLYRHGRSVYEIEVDNAAGVEHGVKAVFCDDQPLAEGRIRLQTDGQRHCIRVVMG